MSTTPDIPNRPTPEYLASLFAKHGIKPSTNTYLEKTSKGRLCGCEIGAMLAESIGIETARKLVSEKDYYTYYDAITKQTGLPISYLDGIDEGFTGGRKLSPSGEDPEFDAGVDDGIAAHQIVFGENAAQLGERT